MKRLQIILIVLAIAMVGTLYSLPKVVVDNDEANRNAIVDESLPGEALENHSEAIPEKDLPRIENWKSQLISGGQVQNNEMALDSLMDVFISVNKYDSAAYYAGLFADSYQEIDHWYKAGDAYFEAFTYALNEAKLLQLTTKAREYYNMILDSGENDLTIRNNIAMTYVEGPSPMQGILMLRSILEEDPQNEKALFNMGRLSMISNQFEIAIGRFESLVKYYPKNIDGQYWLGVCYFQDEQMEKAKTQLQKVKEMDADSLVQTAVNELLQRIK